MDASVMPSAGDEIKVALPVTSRIWFAVCEDLFDHEVVGANVKTPIAADAKRPAWQPMVMWLWLIKEAARKDRVRLLSGKRIRLRRGQIAVSLRHLLRFANWRMKSMRVFLERLRRNEMITIDLSEGGQYTLDLTGSALADVWPKKGTGLTVITLCNYDRFQHGPREKGTGRAQEGHRRGTGGAQYNTENKGTERHHRSPEGVNGKEEDARDGKHPSGTDAAKDGRLPFSADSIRAVIALDENPEALIEAYLARTASKRIADPSAYLLTMARQSAAKRLGVTVEQLKKIASGNKTERVLATANVVGAFSKPSEDAMRIAHRYRSPAHIAIALERIAGKSFTSQAAADRAFEGEFVVLRFSGRAA